MRDESKRERYDALYTALYTERSAYVSRWQEVADYVLSYRLNLSQDPKQKVGDKRNNLIVNSHAGLAYRTLRSGMMSGMTNPARPWMRILTTDPDINKYHSMKAWLSDVTQRLNFLFTRSNLYNVLPMIYGHQSLFSVAAAFMLEDDLDVLRMYSQPPGTFLIAVNERGIVDTIVREIPMTIRQLVRRFVDQSLPESKRWSNVTDTVKTLWDANKLDELVTVVQVVTNNVDYDHRYIGKSNKKFSSTYYEKGGDTGVLLSEGGYNEFPALVPRWDVDGPDPYGTTCPGLEAIGDSKALQLMEKRKAEAIEKMVRPPMIGPSTLRNAKASILPGDITYLDVRDGQQGFKPVFDVNPRIAELVGDMEVREKRISRAFYEDLFLMLSMSDRREITAAEVAERHEEKLLLLGPTIERDNDELLDPMVWRAFSIAQRAGMIPPRPREFAGVTLKVEYTSIMAAAQKMVGLSNLERFTGYVGNIAGVAQEVMDGVDLDEAIENYADMTGINPRIMRDKKVRDKIRAERAASMQAQAQAAQMEQLAKGAKTMSETDVSSDNALTRMTTVPLP